MQNLPIKYLSTIRVAEHAQTPGKIKHSIQVLLPNGWKLTPAGSSITLGDLPLNLKVSPGGKYAAVTNNGQSTQSVELIDPHQQKVLDEKIIKKRIDIFVLKIESPLIY